MKRVLIPALLSTFFCFPTLASAQTNKVSLTTYYPAPFGAYDRLRLVPRPDLGTTCSTNEKGTLYVPSTGATPWIIQYCDNSGTWSPLVGGVFTKVSQAAGYDSENPKAIDQYIPITAYPNAATAPYLGIGTNDPRKPLHIAVSKNAMVNVLALENTFDQAGAFAAGSAITFRGNTTSQPGGSAFMEMAALRVNYDLSFAGPVPPPQRGAYGMDFMVRNGIAGSLLRVLNVTAYQLGKVGIRTAISQGILEVNTLGSSVPILFAVSSDSEGGVNGDIFSIISNGNVGIGVAAPSVPLEVNGDIKAGTLILTSDGNLKKDIVPVTGALDKVSRLQGVSFEWKDNPKDQRKHMGVIAQDVEKVFPEVVYGKEGAKGVDYPSLIAPLIEAVKELKTKNDVLSQQVQEQSFQIRSQQQKIEYLQNSLKSKEPVLNP